MPRRFGLAPSLQAEHGGSVDQRAAAHKAMFDAIDAKPGSARGWIDCAQFVELASTHVAGKAGTIGATEVVVYVPNFSEVKRRRTCMIVVCSSATGSVGVLFSSEWEAVPMPS